MAHLAGVWQVKSRHVCLVLIVVKGHEMVMITSITCLYFKTRTLWMYHYHIDNTDAQPLFRTPPFVGEQKMTNIYITICNTRDNRWNKSARHGCTRLDYLSCRCCQSADTVARIQASELHLWCWSFPLGQDLRHHQSHSTTAAWVLKTSVEAELSFDCNVQPQR